MKHVFIINPVAGKTDHTEEITQKVHRLFAIHPEYGEAVIEITKGTGDATQIAKRHVAVGDPLRLYSCGGDGTLCEVFNGMVGHANCTLSCLPYGSGNDFIKAFGHDSAPNFLDLEQLVTGVCCDVDYLKTNGIASLNITTVGFDASVCVAMNRYRKLPLINGKAAYVLAVADRFFKSLKNHYAFVLDGKKLPMGDYIFGVAANGRYYGGTFHPAPYADIQDGLIDFVTVPAVSHLTFIQLVGAYSKGVHFEKAEFIRLRRVKTLQILADEPIPVNIDGDVRPMKDPFIEIVPKGVSFLVPKAVFEAYEQERPIVAQKAIPYLQRG